MIGEPAIPVLCDNCFKDVLKEDALDVRYSNYSGDSGYYALPDDEDILEWVQSSHGWYVVGENTYCCNQCKVDAEGNE